MFTWMQFFLLLVPPANADAPVHKIDVRVAGPLAMVEVWRGVEANVRQIGDKQIGTFFDLDLPEGASLLDWEVVIGRGRGTKLSPRSEVEAVAALAAGFKMRVLTPPAPPEEGTDYRVHVTPIADGERAVLHYRYSVLAGCKEGRLVLRVPDSREESPAPADVTVTFEPSSDGIPLAQASLAGKPAEIHAGGRKVVMRGPVPSRPGWEIGWSYTKSAGTLDGTAVAAAAIVNGVSSAGGKAHTVPQYALAGLLCRTGADAKPLIPGRVLLLVDRSRSVGQGGLSAERALARALIEALPPSVPFDAVLFGSQATPVFALPRMPTREALDVFTNAADPNRLENGTDVVAALARARTLLPTGGEGGAGSTWVVLVTDGALPASQTVERMQTALGSAAGAKVLVLLERQFGDEDMAASAVADYARFARGFGGLVRVVPPAGPAETAQGILAAMARGGDLLDVRLEMGKMTDALPPGQGASLALTSAARLPRDRRVRFSARGLDGQLQTETTPVPVKREWLDPLIDRGAARRTAWSGATSGMAVTVMPGPAVAKKPVDSVVRGRMDPLVLRNALALAFIPRARACYVSRRVAKAGDAFLRGRLKLELSIERGELHDAVVRDSTLGNPDIENCVRQAAWAVEYPRPEHRDAPTMANLNLVFQPRTPPETSADASAMDRDIELVLGPLTLTADFQDLLQEKAKDKASDKASDKSRGQ